MPHSIKINEKVVILEHGGLMFKALREHDGIKPEDIMNSLNPHHE